MGSLPAAGRRAAAPREAQLRAALLLQRAARAWLYRILERRLLEVEKWQLGWQQTLGEVEASALRALSACMQSDTGRASRIAQFQLLSTTLKQHILKVNHASMEETLFELR